MCARVPSCTTDILFAATCLLPHGACCATTPSRPGPGPLWGFSASSRCCTASRASYDQSSVFPPPSPALSLHAYSRTCPLVDSPVLPSQHMSTNHTRRRASPGDMLTVRGRPASALRHTTLHARSSTNPDAWQTEGCGWCDHDGSPGRDRCTSRPIPQRQ